MVKKRLANGDTCEKCAQAEEMLRRRGYWDRIDQVIWVLEGEETSAGAELAARLGIELAPFFVVRDEAGAERTYTSALRLAKECFQTAPAHAARSPEAPAPADPGELTMRFAQASPQEIVDWALGEYGERCAIAFQGGEDIVLLDMATRTGKSFSVLTVDTGRLRDETHSYLDDVRRRYGIRIEFLLPDAIAVTDLVTRKGMNSFLRDGHHECCEIRRLGPLRRAIAGRPAWITGRRRRPGDAEHALPSVERDPDFTREAGPLRINPLARWSRDQVWSYIRRHEVPYHPLHDRGFTRIGCEPCTRPTGGSYGRPARWWWEQPEEAEQGAHESGDGI